MKANRPQLFRAAIVAAACIAGVATEAMGQFSRGPYNPYGPSSPGTGNPSLTTGSTTVNRGPFGQVGSQAMSLNTPAWGRIRIDFRNGMPILTGGAFQQSNSGYTYGGVSPSNYLSRTEAYIPPPPVNTPAKAFDRWVNDRQRQNMQEEALKAQKLEELHRSLSGPDRGEITSALALNAILDSLRTMPEKVQSTPPVAIDAAFIKQLNFTRGSGSVGLLRKQGKIDWHKNLLNLTPAAGVAKVREQIEKRFLDAFEQVNGGGQADPENIKALLKSIDVLSDMASNRASSLTFTENLEIKRYLRSLEDAVTFMKQPDASEWMPGKHKAKPKTLQELVQIMSDKNVRFAPALVGTDAVYITMHRLLATLHAQAAP
jgi:hypothetical protein